MGSGNKAEWPSFAFFPRGRPFHNNTTLGRDLLDPAKKNNYAFITNTAGGIGMVTDDFYFTRNINFPDEQLVPMHREAAGYSKAQQDSAKKKLSVFTSAFFETAKYMLMNNKRE